MNLAFIFWGPVQKRIIVTVLLLVGVLGFWFFQGFLFLKILAVVLAILSLYTFWFKEKGELIVFFSLYFGIYTLYNLYFSGLYFPQYLWQSMLTIAAAAALLYLILFWPYRHLYNTYQLIFYQILTILILMEVFLALTFWPINPETKSLILVLTFYTISNLVLAKFTESLNFQTVSRVLSLSAILLILAISTTKWFVS